MGWAVGYDDNWKRDIGYGVPATCDHPGCKEEIDRGLAHVCCGSEAYGGEEGCGLFFCGKHLVHRRKDDGDWGTAKCERCNDGKKPFEPKPDVKPWLRHKLKDASWQQWRDENPKGVAEIKLALKPLQKSTV
jgi:hypothetical protein